MYHGVICNTCVHVPVCGTQPHHNIQVYIQSDSISVKSKKMLVRVGLNRQLNRKTRARDSGAPTSLAHALYVFVGGARSV